MIPEITPSGIYRCNPFLITAIRFAGFFQQTINNSDIKRHMKKVKRYFIQAFILVIILLCSRTVAALEGQDIVSTANYANRSLEYYYYIPERASKDSSASYPLMVMVPGLSGQGRALVNREVRDFAEKEQFIIIAPSFKFDEQNWGG